MSNITLPDPIDLETLVRIRAFQLLLERARAVSSASLVEATGVRPEKLDAVIDGLARAGRIRLDPAGMLVGSAGLSVVPDRHEIELDGRRLWTWCAYDIFGIFGALAASGRALSPSPHDRRPIEVVFASGRPRGSAVLFRPDLELMSSCASVYDEWCPNSNLFANRELAERWAVEHKLSGQILSLDRAADLATEEWRWVTDPK